MLRPITFALLLAACGPASEQPDPGHVTIDEAKALDDAAAMLAERDAPVTEPAAKGEE